LLSAAKWDDVRFLYIGPLDEEPATMNSFVGLHQKECFIRAAALSLTVKSKTVPAHIYSEVFICPFCPYHNGNHGTGLGHLLRSHYRTAIICPGKDAVHKVHGAAKTHREKCSKVLSEKMVERIRGQSAAQIEEGIREAKQALIIQKEVVRQVFEHLTPVKQAPAATPAATPTATPKRVLTAAERHERHLRHEVTRRHDREVNERKERKRNREEGRARDERARLRTDSEEEAPAPAEGTKSKKPKKSRR
jgi:hypothetical protein